MVNKCLVKAIIDTVIFLEFSGEEMLDPMCLQSSWSNWPESCNVCQSMKKVK